MPPRIDNSKKNEGFELCLDFFLNSRRIALPSGSRNRILYKIIHNKVLSSACQMLGEDFAKFCGLLRLYELYINICSCTMQVSQIAIDYLHSLHLFELR